MSCDLKIIMKTDTKSERRRKQVGNYAYQLIDSQRRLAKLHEQGVGALSRYDVEIAHQGNADEALLTAKCLLSNQVKYFQQKIAEFKTDSEQLGLF
jgi:hypothetical protein